MSKKILILPLTFALTSLVLLCLSLMLLLPNKLYFNQQTTLLKPVIEPAARLSLQPNRLLISSSSGSMTINLQTNSPSVSQIEIELAFDPEKISNLNITPNPRLTNFQLLPIPTQLAGRFFYILTFSPPTNLPRLNLGLNKLNQPLARLNFSSELLPGEQTQLDFLPKTEIIAAGNNSSILQKSIGGVITRITK